VTTTQPLLDARSALFDVLGDHLRRPPADGRAPVAALVRLLAPIGVQEPAVRTAVSRMLRQGWLSAVRLPSGPGYALTPKALRRLDEAARRIYRTSSTAWDGHWHLLVVSGPAGRGERERLHASLGYLGYGCLGAGTWVAPRPAPELDAVLAEAGVAGQRFTALHEGDADTLVDRAWDLDSLAASYRQFLDDARAALDGACTCTDEGAFAARLHLVHAWRRFLNVDPGLPAQLLPADWPGTTAAAWFDEQAARLQPAARRFVETCLASAGTASPAAPAPAPEGLLPCPRPSETAPCCSTSTPASPPSPSTARRA
jgi:phenylacetic acid degradation operon negative regulatory protein